MEICALFKANIDFRHVLNYDWFKDSSSRTESIILIDSFHFTEFCNQVEQYGFPDRKKVGLNTFQLQAPLKHFSGLLFFKNERADFFIKKWKWLMPYIKDAALNGSIPYGFYRYLLDQEIIAALQEYGRDEDVAFFSKFHLNY